MPAVPLLAGGGGVGRRRQDVVRVLLLHAFGVGDESSPVAQNMSLSRPNILSTTEKLRRALGSAGVQALCWVPGPAWH